MRLFELFQQTTNFTWESKKPNSWWGYFTAGRIKYLVEFTRYIESKDSWLVNFQVAENNSRLWIKDDSLTGTGNEFKVFSKLISMVRIWIDEVKPKKIVFTAKEKNRQTLYMKMVEDFSRLLFRNRTNSTIWFTVYT